VGGTHLNYWESCFSIEEETMTFDGKDKHHVLICIPIGIWVACSLYKLADGIE